MTSAPVTGPSGDDTMVTAAVPARRRRADAARNAQRVLDAARIEFFTRGADASLEDVARRAGVGIGTLYRHYPTRQILLEAVFRDQVDAACEHAEELSAALAPFDALTAWLRAQLGMASQCQALAASVMITMLDESGAGPSPCAVMHDKGGELLARAQAAGEARADIDIDDLLRLVSAVALATEDAVDRDERAVRMFELLMDGVRAPRT